MNYRLVFMDNFYSRHTFATHLKQFSDNDIKVIGTVRCNMVDSANRDNVLKGLKRVNDKPMHSWVLVRAHDTVSSTSNKRRKVQSNTMDNVADLAAFVPLTICIIITIIIVMIIIIVMVIATIAAIIKTTPGQST